MRFVISGLKKFYNISLKKERAKKILLNTGKQSIASCQMQQLKKRNDIKPNKVLHLDHLECCTPGDLEEEPPVILTCLVPYLHPFPFAQSKKPSTLKPWSCSNQRRPSCQSKAHPR